MSTRVLHLLDAAADFQTGRCAEHLTRQLGPGFAADVRTIGPGGSYANAATAVYRLRRIRGNYDVVHAWGPRALTLAAMATRVPLVYSPPPVAPPRVIRWVGAVMAHRDVHVICPTSTLRRLHVERGVPLDRCHLIRPGVDFARVRRRRDADLRARLGFAPDDRVILAVGEHSYGANHVGALWAGGILHVLDRRYKVLLWGRGAQAGYLVRMAGKLGQARAIAVADRDLGRRVEFEEFLPASDLAVVSAKGAVATLPISLCMAAALPIVSSVTYTTGELLEDRHTALMTPTASPRLLAKRVTELFDDAQLQWSVSDMARTEAYEYFSLTRFLAQYRAAYEQAAAGRPRIEVPGQTAGAGLRFHGRA